MRFEGGKMLLRVDPDDRSTANTVESCARAVSDLAAYGLVAMVEPFLSHRVEGCIRNDLTAEAMIPVAGTQPKLSGGGPSLCWLHEADTGRTKQTPTGQDGQNGRPRRDHP
jgi:hypothetical protein